MVATRRGVRVYSPTKTGPDQPSDVPATPSTLRRTRYSTRQAESPTPHAQGNACSQPNESEEGRLRSPVKRCTRTLRLHSPEQPSTPGGSTHDADTSDLESCYSVGSDIEPRMTRRRRHVRPVCLAEEDISEVESCSSAVSAAKAGRSTRKRAVPDPAQVVLVPDTESCTSVASESQRVTRSQRKTKCTRSSTKRQTEDSELSDADSCASSVSVAEVSQSALRRSTRSRRQTRPIPMYLNEASESSGSPAPSRGTRKTPRGKIAAAVDVNDTKSCDSEGFESGPTYSMTTRRREKIESSRSKALDSDSDLTDIHSPQGSPSPSQVKGTPCSSRTGSGSSSRGARASRPLIKDLSIVLVKNVESEVEDCLLNESALDSTVIAEDADCTLLEEDKIQTVDEKEKEGEDITNLTSSDAPAAEDGLGDCPLPKATDAKGDEKRINVFSEKHSHIHDAAVTASVQQEELSAENKDGDTSKMKRMQETVQSSEPLKPSQSVTVTVCEEVSENTAETEEKDKDEEMADVDPQPSQGIKSLDENTLLEMQPSKEEKMEVSTSISGAQQVDDSSEVRVESIQVTSQEHKITVDPEPEQPKDISVQKRKITSLLESSDDESSEEEEEEDLGYKVEERAGPSKSEEAAASVEGLFMIDTRPGQEADEDYYKEQGAKTKEVDDEQDEFVDEEGDDDDDDEDAELLFSSRNPHLKELSSRIDPGIRVKELGGLYINFDGSKSKPASSSLQKRKEKKMQDEVMKKSVIGPEFEKKEAVPPYSESKQALKLKRRVEREKSTGNGWFDMKAPELTKELKGDLQVLKMRGSLDNKRFYKKNDRDGFPKYFQVGTVVDNAVDFYHSRVPKKGRKRTMVEELMADAEFRQNNKKKYQNIVTERAAQGAGKRNRKKNKFHKK